MNVIFHKVTTEGRLGTIYAGEYSADSLEEALNLACDVIDTTKNIVNICFKYHFWGNEYWYRVSKFKDNYWCSHGLDSHLGVVYGTAYQIHRNIFKLTSYDVEEK